MSILEATIEFDNVEEAFNGLFALARVSSTEFTVLADTYTDVTGATKA